MKSRIETSNVYAIPLSEDATYKNKQSPMPILSVPFPPSSPFPVSEILQNQPN